MTDIIVIDSEESLSLLIAETLSRSFSVRFYNMNSMYLSGEGNAVNLWRTDSLHGLVTDDCIVVMGENTAAIPRLTRHGGNNSKRSQQRTDEYFVISDV